MFLLLAACSTPAPPPVEPPAPPAPEPTPLQEHMGEHFSAGTIAFESFLHGEIGPARQKLTWLAGHSPPPGLPEGSEAALDALHDAARQAASGARAEQVAEGIGLMGARCGGCHGAVGVGVTIELGDPPSPSTELLPHMQRHQWAVRALWAGLVMPSDAAWKQGADALGGSPLPAGAFDVPQISKESWAAAEQAHAKATAAGTLSAPDERAAAFAEIISACANCHTEMRGE